MNSRKLLLDRLLLSLALILEWHCAALTWHWTLDFLFCINQCLNSWRPSKFQSCANKITISITLFVRNALVAPVICDENQFRAAWYMEIMAYVYVREKLWRYELSDRGNMQDKYADCGLVVGGRHERWSQETWSHTGRCWGDNDVKDDHQIVQRKSACCH